MTYGDIAVRFDKEKSKFHHLQKAFDKLEGIKYLIQQCNTLNDIQQLHICKDINDKLIVHNWGNMWEQIKPIILTELTVQLANARREYQQAQEYFEERYND